MAEYTKWIIGGLIPVHVIDAKIDPEKRNITINCFAARELMDGADPEYEIKRFQDIAARSMKNQETYNAGSNLQVADKNPVIYVTNGTQVWDRCALHQIPVQYGVYYKLSGIFFTLNIEYEDVIGGGFTVYEPPYTDKTRYPNIEWYSSTDKVYSSNWDSPTAGTEFGWAKIKSEQPVKRVLVYGSACELPATLTVEGSVEGTQQWSVSHEGREAEVYAGRGVQLLTFNMITPSKEIVIFTSIHDLTQLSAAVNHGCWPIWIRTDFAEE